MSSQRKFTFAISYPDEFLVTTWCRRSAHTGLMHVPDWTYA